MRERASGIENGSHGCRIHQSRKGRGRALGVLAVSTNTSWVDARSRAEGVTIVWVLMKIFSLRVMAMRTSFSLTKSGTLRAGAGAGPAGRVAAGVTSIAGFPAPLLVDAAAFAAASLAPVAAAGALDAGAAGWLGDRRSKMALTAEVATSAALGLSVAGEPGGLADAAAPRGIPLAPRTFSTILAIKRRSGMTVGFALAFAAEALSGAV